MSSSSPSCPISNFEESFYGAVTVGERGQIVIPVEARNDLGIHPGDKILILKHPFHKGLMMFKIEAMRDFLDDFSNALENLSAKTKEDPS